MRAGMFVTAAFRASQPVERVVVPASAVVHLHDKDWVFLPAGQNQFRRVAVQLGAQEKDGAQQVMSGLKAGDQVVTNGLQFSSAAEE
jgi:cobalt-zinc-cadmium efflux system membrane fusion protein